MFTSLSFKKFQRRIRSPFTFFKKLSKKQRKGAHQRQASRQIDTHHQAGIEKKLVQDAAAAPTLDVKIPSTSNAVTVSSDSGVFLPPAPRSLSSESGPTSRKPAFERPLPDIVDDGEFNSTVQAGINNIVLSEEKDVAADKIAEVVNSEDKPLPDPIVTNDVEPTEMHPKAVATDVEVETKEQGIVSAVNVQAPPAKIVPQENEPKSHNPVVEVKSPPLPSQEEIAAEEPEAAPASSAELQPVKELTQVIEMPKANLTSASMHDKDPIITPVDCVVSIETSTKVSEPAVKEVETPPEETPLTESPVEEKSIQQLDIVAANEGLRKPISIQNLPPQTLRSVSSPKALTPPTTPRKRVTSEGQTTKDKEVMEELQASVRSREKKRKEQERIQAAEKERMQRERSLKLQELEKATNSPDKDDVLRDVRAWRKQREASLKKSPDDAAKIAAYREAFAREEIMLELQSAVQSRSERPFGEDPAEKRQQLVLEEIYARRVPAAQA